jgi:hypothetical protein
MRCNPNVAWTNYQEAPSELLQVLSDEFKGVSFPRLVGAFLGRKPFVSPKKIN